LTIAVDGPDWAVVTAGENKTATTHATRREKRIIRDLKFTSGQAGAQHAASLMKRVNPQLKCGEHTSAVDVVESRPRALGNERGYRVADIEFYSWRRATMGSVWMARRAGR
jgi:hypothetical protein